MRNNWQKESVFISLLGAFLLLPFAQAKLVFFGVPLYLPEIAILIALWFYFLRLFYPSAHSKGIRKFPLDTIFMTGVLLFFLGAVVSFLANPFSLTGLGMLKSWFFFPLIATYLVFYEAQDPQKRHLFFATWFVVLSSTALGNLMFLAQGILTYDGRLAGMYTSPNFLALFVAPGILIALYLWPLFQQRTYRSLLLLGSGLIGVVIFFTHSYGVFLALLLSLLFFYGGKMVLFGWRKKTFLALGFLILIFLGALSLEYGSAKWQSLSTFDVRSSLSSRLMIWQSAEKILLDHPVFGIGPGRFQTMYLEYQRYFPPYLEWAVPEPHNFYIAIFLSTGALGFFGFCLFMGRLLFLLVEQMLKKEKEPFQALLFSSLLLFFLVYGITDTPYFKNDLALSFFLFLALILSTFRARCDTDVC